MNEFRSLRRKAAVAAVAALSLAGALAATTGEASAWYDRYGRWHGGNRGGAVAAGVVGGLALGAL
ncbi:MAG: hypothetical protein JWN93_2322, partial [Hyphomicrobiales bacterium]|nr:hypothetical protein [Hyphomicrobiales bacterium]